MSFKGSRLNVLLEKKSIQKKKIRLLHGPRSMVYNHPPLPSTYMYLLLTLTCSSENICCCVIYFEAFPRHLALCTIAWVIYTPQPRAQSGKVQVGSAQENAHSERNSDGTISNIKITGGL